MTGEKTDPTDTLEAMNRKLSEADGRRKEFLAQAERHRGEETQNARSRKTCERALEVVRKVAGDTLEQLSYRLKEPATLALQGVFPDPYELNVKFTPRRGQTECDVWFERRGIQVDPLDAAGLGAADVAAFGIQLALLSMQVEAGKTMPVALLDEPFKHLKGAEANRCAIEMVRNIAEKLGIQVIMVSDERAAREDIEAGADKVIYCSHDGEKTVIEEG